MRLIAAVLACALVSAPATALAQRGNSGLPDNPGNPIADLQQQINALQAALNSLLAQPSAITVNCGLGQTVSATLAAYPGPLDITIVGTCVENVVVSRDDVTLQAGSPGAGITAANPGNAVIRLEGAHRTRIVGLTLIGGDSGVQASRGSTGDVTGCTIQGGQRFGIVASNGATLNVDGCTITNSNGQGVIAANESAIYLTNSTVSNHVLSGVAAVRNSHVRIGQDSNGSPVVKPVTISATSSGSGVSVTDASAVIMVGGSVQSSRNGIFVGRSSTAQIGVGSFGLLGPVAITGNTQDGIAIEGSQATVLGSNISNNGRFGIMVHNGASARIGIGDTTSGYVGNTIASNGSTGIHVNGASSAYIGGNTINANGTSGAFVFLRSGIGVFAASVNLAGRNVISNHPSPGIFVGRNGAAQIGDPGFGLPTAGPDANKIFGNGVSDPGTRAGVFAYQGGTIEIRDAEITNNFGAGVQAFQGSQVEIRRGIISGSVTTGGVPGHGVSVGHGSVARIRGAATITGNQVLGVSVFNNSGVDFRDESGVPQVFGNGGTGLGCSGDSRYSASPFPAGVAGVVGISCNPTF